MAKDTRITLNEGLSSKNLAAGLSKEGTFQKGFSSATLQTALKPSASSQSQGTSTSGSSGGSTQKK